MRIELSVPADDEALRRLLRETPIGGRIRIGFEREPSFFAAADREADRHATVVARDDAGAVVGMGTRAVRTAFVNGEPVALGYLGQLRSKLAPRGDLLSLLRAGFEQLRATRCADEAPFDITSIATDNARARRLLEAGLGGLPRYREVESLVTFLVPVRGQRRLRDDAVDVRRATDALAPEILACLERWGRRHQFAPRWAAANIPDLARFHVALEGARVVGCLARWDQRAFKQVVVRGYDRALGTLRPVLNLFGACLPRAGRPLALAFLAPLAIDGDDPRVFRALLGAALDAARDEEVDFLTFGFAARHPLCDVARRSLRGRAYDTTLYAVEWEGEPAALDGRIAHPEVALL